MKWIALSLLVSISCFANSQGAMRAQKPVPPSKEVATLLKKMRDTYSGLKSAKMTMTFTEFGEDKNVTILSEGSFLAPRSFRMKSTGLPGFKTKAYVLVTNGKQIQFEGAGPNPFAENFSMQGMVLSLPQTNLEVICFWDWARQLSTEQGGNMRMSTFKLSKGTWKNKPFTVLEETAKAQGILVKYFIDAKTNLIWKTEQYRLNAKDPLTISTLDTLQLNARVDPKLFKVTAKPRQRKTDEQSAVG